MARDSERSNPGRVSAGNPLEAQLKNHLMIVKPKLVEELQASNELLHCLQTMVSGAIKKESRLREQGIDPQTVRELMIHDLFPTTD